jgi:hypothetical protein
MIFCNLEPSQIVFLLCPVAFAIPRILPFFRKHSSNALLTSSSAVLSPKNTVPLVPLKQ